MGGHGDPPGKVLTMELEDKNIVIVGAGRSGLAAARYCLGHGAHPILNDHRNRDELAGRLSDFEELGIPLRLGSHSPESFSDADGVILSPGVPTNIEALLSLRDRGIPIIGELELAGSLVQAPIVAVTGTNGKSTTVSLIHAMLGASERKSALGGNIGKPFIELVEEEPDADVFVIEVSSYQLETIDRFRPHIAVLLNITPDHLSRHRNLAGYAAAKGRLFINQEHDDWAVYNADDSEVVSVASGSRARRLPWSLRRALSPGLYRKGSLAIWFREGHQETYDLSQFALSGDHYAEDALAAIAAARLAGASIDGVQSTLDCFRGLPHRFETLGTCRGITFINDSKATNVDAAVRAVQGVPSGKLILLAGGEDKGASYQPLREALIGQHAKAVCVFGEAAGVLQENVTDALPTFRHTTLEEALSEAMLQATDGDVVLLAPACSSFDQFTDFLHRGEVFRQLVQQLGEVSA